MKVTNKQNSGFTLVELAIVIVIIGLLVGGVLQGQELIKQAQIRSAISSIQGYNAAINTFRAKYNEMPGDISRASTFGLNAPKGGSTATACATSATDVTTSAGGDGNGNGTLQGSGTTACSLTTDTTLADVAASTAVWGGEIANFWAHLGNAQLVKGAFAPTTASTGNTVNVGYPSMPVGTGVIALSSGGLTYWVIGVPGQIATMASMVTASGTLSPSEAFGIDGKLDDGSPLTGVTTTVNGAYAGSLVAQTAAATSCVSNATGSPYNIAGTYADSKICLLAVRADG